MSLEKGQKGSVFVIIKNKQTNKKPKTVVNHTGHMKNRLRELKYVPIEISEARKENKLALLLICEKTCSTQGELCFVASSLDTFGEAMGMKKHMSIDQTAACSLGSRNMVLALWTLKR